MRLQAALARDNRFGPLAAGRERHAQHLAVLTVPVAGDPNSDSRA